MDSPVHPVQHRPGMTLLDTVMAIGVLAFVIPLVLGAIASSGESVSSAKAETRAAWILPVCMEEIRASREGRSLYFPATTAGQAFPAAGGIWALAFGEDGQTLGTLSSAEYDQGLRTLNGTPVRYIANMTGVLPANQANPAVPPPLHVTITVEYPSTLPSERRTKLPARTYLP